MFDYIKERNDKLDTLLAKMEQVVKENVLIINQLSAAMAEAKQYREEKG